MSGSDGNEGANRGEGVGEFEVRAGRGGKGSKDRTLVRQFQREIERQCRFVMISLQDMDQARDEGDGDFFWYSVESFLVSVGRISRILWPEDPDETGLRDELRQSLDLPDESPLIPLDVVEQFEHFDRLLEEWYTSSGSRRFFDLYTEPLDILADTTPGDRFRGYDTESHSILLHGRAYPVAPVSEMVEELASRARGELSKPRFDNE